MASTINAGRKRRGSACDNSKQFSSDDVNTFVFLKTKVMVTSPQEMSELSMLAVNKMDISQGPKTVYDVPRYKDTLVLSFDASQCGFGEGCTSSSSVDFAGNSSNTAAWKTILHFLERQKHPVCLLARDNADFENLKRALGNADKADIVDGLLCATIFGERNPADTTGRQGSDVETAKEHAISLLRAYRKKSPSTIMGYFRKIRVSERSSASKRQKSTTALVPTGEIPSPRWKQQIETFIFLDLETTGLIETNPGIGELCMIAVQRNQLTVVDKKALKKIIPEMSEECSIMLKPKREFSAEASKINGLTTKGLADRSILGFDEAAAGILKTFLERQMKPICFVAHNGEFFDFPILRSHVIEAGKDVEIWRDTYAADSLLGLRANELPKQRGIFRLPNVYQRLVGDESLVSSAALHTAEGDVLRLIAITRVSSGLLNWLEGNKKRFMTRPNDD